MNVAKLKQYPIIEEFNNLEPNTIEQVRQAINEFGFFYIKDSTCAREKIDRELANLKDSVDVYYGEDAYTGKGSVFHGTYTRIKPKDKIVFQQYFELVSQLLDTFSLALGYPKEFLQNFSKQENYGLYFYDREEEYLEYINKVDINDIAVPPHKDRSLITIVVSIKGLESYNEEFGWFSAPDLEGYISIQVGTILQNLMQQQIKANIHRVRGYDSSKALFWGNLDPVKSKG